MNENDFCIELALCGNPTANVDELSQEIKEVFNLNLSSEYISNYLSSKWIESEHHERESRKQEYYSIHSKEIFP